MENSLWARMPELSNALYAMDSEGGPMDPNALGSTQTLTRLARGGLVPRLRSKGISDHHTRASTPGA